MKTHSQILLVSSIIFAMAFTLCKADTPSDPLRIEMIRAIPGTPADFIVLLSNVTTNPMVLFDETCSFGYNNLWIETVDWPNRTNLITRTSTVWFSNYPRYVSVEPNGRVAIPVRLETNTWQNLECLLDDVPWKRKIRAVYQQSRPQIRTENAKNDRGTPFLALDLPIFEGQVTSELYPLEDYVPLLRLRTRIRTKDTDQLLKKD